MARIYAVGAETSGDRVERMEVRFDGLARRVVPREQVLAWMADGHSVLPLSEGTLGAGLQRVEVEGEAFIRRDNQPMAADDLPSLPAL